MTSTNPQTPTRDRRRGFIFALVGILVVAGLFAGISLVNGTGTPTVVTDKPDYGPYGLVTIMGSGFLGTQALDVVVTAPDGGVYTGAGNGTPGFDSVTTDSTGAFVYFYQLNGYGAGNYLVEVFDHTDSGHTTVLASTTFYDDTGLPTSVTASYNTGTGQLTVSGSWTWPSCPNSNKAAGFALFINGTNPVAPGTGALDGTSATNTMHPVNMVSYQFPCATSGTYGPDTHTLATAPTSVCVVIYDIHSDKLPPATGKHSTVGAGAGRNMDNSYEVATTTKPANAYGSGSCTPPSIITPTATFTVSKDFVPNNGANVTVSLSCASGSVSPASASASEATPATFTITGYTGNPTCTATESPIPNGYSSTGNCSAALLTGSCTVTNNQNSAQVVVLKDFSDNNTANVTVGVTCTSGSVANDDPTASEADPANFTITGFTTGATCTATEAVPGGYTASQTGCAGLPVTNGGTASCIITNTLNSAPFTVSKDFIPDVATPVTVSVSCASGTAAPASASVSDGSPFTFTITGFTGNPTCTASESPIPSGYSSSGTCAAALLPPAGSCTITNTLITNPFIVLKDFSDGNTAAVTVSVACSSGSVTPASAPVTETSPATFTVSAFSGNPTCTATESPVPTGYESSGTCSASLLSPAGSCTITNTLRTAQVVVSKDFIPDDAADVTVSLSCTSGSVANDDPTASEADPANFTVTGFNTGATCTATESVPVGYAASGSPAGTCSAAISTGSCTITNTTSATFTVSKDFVPNNPALVTVSLFCVSGSVSPASASASEAAPAVFTVTGFAGNPTCTATESPIPAGYNSTGTCSAALLATGCTVVNNQILTNPPTPCVGLACPQGGVVELPVFAEGSPAAGQGRVTPIAFWLLVPAALLTVCSAAIWAARRS